LSLFQDLSLLPDIFPERVNFMGQKRPYLISRQISSSKILQV